MFVNIPNNLIFECILMDSVDIFLAIHVIPSPIISASAHQLVSFVFGMQIMGFI